MQFVWLALWLGSISIGGTTTCPSRDDVMRALEPLIGAQGLGDERRIWLSTFSDGLSIDLRDAAGDVLASRRLQSRASCQDLATAAAVVVASWQQEHAPPPTYPAPAEPPPAPVTPSTRRDPLAVSLPPVPSAPAPPPRRGATLAIAESPSQKDRSISGEVGAAFYGSFAGTFAPGALAYVDVSRGGSHWALRATAFGAAAREIDSGSGIASWSRFGVKVGPRLALPMGHWRLDLHADATAALLRVVGSGFAVNATSDSFDPGFGIGVELGLRIGSMRPFAGLAMNGWPRPQEIDVSGASTTPVVPRLEAMVVMGVAVGNSL